MAAPRNDDAILYAVEAATNGHYVKAARFFQDAGNQLRDPVQKKNLWDAAAEQRRKARSE